MSSVAGQPQPHGQPDQDRRIAQYEFDEKESEICRALGSAIRFVGTAWIVLGLVNGISAMIQLVYGSRDILAGTAGVAYAVCMFLIGVWFRGAGRSFVEIARTRGNDMSNLMQALVRLRSAFVLQRNLLLVLIALIAAGAILAIFALALNMGTLTITTS